LDAVPNSQNYASFQSIDRNREGAIRESEWDGFRARIRSTTEDHGLLAIRPLGDTAAILWRENSSISEVASPLLYPGRPFLVRNGGIVTCLDAATGKGGVPRSRRCARSLLCVAGGCRWTHLPGLIGGRGNGPQPKMPWK